MSETYQVAPITEATVQQINRLVADLNNQLSRIGSAIAALQPTGNIPALVDQSGGRSPSVVISAVPGTYNQALLARNFASVVKKVNEIIAKVSG